MFLQSLNLILIVAENKKIEETYTDAQDYEIFNVQTCINLLNVQACIDLLHHSKKTVCCVKIQPRNRFIRYSMSTLAVHILMSILYFFGKILWKKTLPACFFNDTNLPSIFLKQKMGRVMREN